MLAWLAAVLTLAVQEKASPASATRVTVLTDDDFHFESDLEGTDASVSVARYKVSIEVFRMAGPQDLFRLSVAGEALEYDFTNLKTLLPGAPEEFAEEVDAYRIDPSYTHVFDAHWSGVLYGTVAWAFEEEGHMRESATGALGIGAFHRFGPDLTLGLALHVQFRIEDHEWIYPLPYVEWKISESALLRTESKAGYGLAFELALDEGGAFGVESRLRYQGRRIRLRRDRPISNGILDDQRALWDIGVRWQPLRNLRVSLYAGLDVWQEFTFEDETGSNRLELETESSPFVGFSASWQF
ncbi:MAG TPA: hypothetical protein VNO22_18375 [Planctomycetota bacterium]|nr:hypothetical protein [Planctomycetota bacterium]